MQPEEKTRDDRTEIYEPEKDGGAGTGIDPNLGGALAYLFGPLTGILLYVLEDDPFVRFHATQSIVVFGGLFVLSIGLSVVMTVLTAVPVVGWLAGLLLGFGALLLAPIGFVLWIYLMYRAYQGDEYGLPIAGPIVRRHLE